MKKIIFLLGVLLLFGASLAPAALALNTVMPSNSVINPNNQTIAFADNNVGRIRFYTVTSTGWNAGTSITLDSGAKCYGLALNSTGDKLYISISNGSASKVMAYTLDTDGQPKIGTPPTTLTAAWSSLSSPAGIAVGGGNRVYVADHNVGRFRVFSTNGFWVGDVTDHLAGQSALYGIAVTPAVTRGDGTIAYKIYVGQKGTDGRIYVFNYDNGNISYANKTITGLQDPTYMTVAGGKLFVSVNGTDGADIMVYDTATDASVGTVKSGIVGDYGYTSFFVSPDNAWLVFKKAQDATESVNGLYKQQIAGIAGITSAALIKTTYFNSDGLALNRNLARVGLSNSLDGSFNGDLTTDSDVANKQPDKSTLKMAQANVSGNPLANGATAETNQVKLSASIVDPENGHVLIQFYYRLAGQGAIAWTVSPTYEVASGATAETVLTLANGGYEWGVSYSDLLGDGSHGLGATFDQNFLPDFIINSFPAPSVTGLEPNSGVQGTTLTNVIVHGTGFQPGATVSFSGGSITTGTVTYNSATQLTIGTLTIDGGATASARDVVVTNPDTKSGIQPGAFTVLDASTAPLISSITPSIGQRGTTIPVVISGLRFASGATVKLTRGANTINGTVASVTGTAINCSFAPLITDQVGLWSVVVTNPDNQSSTLANSFSLVNDLNAVPTVTKIYPRRAPTTAATTIRIIGTNFASSNSVMLQASPAAVQLTNVTVNPAGTMITATIPSGAAVGIWHVTAANNAGTSAPTAADTFEVMPGNENPPVPSQITNLVATSELDRQVPLGWTNPTDNDMAQVELRRYTGAYPAVYSSSTGFVMSDIPEPGVPMNYTDTGLTNGTKYYYVAYIKDTSGNWSAVDYTAPDVNAATATPGLPALSVTSISPDNGKQTNTVRVVNLIGTGFKTGATVKLTHAGQATIDATNLTVANSTTITCDLPLPAGSLIGKWDVVVTSNGQTVTKPNAFTIFAVDGSAPTIGTIAPSTGVAGTAVNATLTGTNYVSGATVVLAKTAQADILGTNVVVTGTQITASFALPVDAATGAWTVMVTNPDTQTGQLVDGFTVTGKVTGDATVPRRLMSEKSGNDVILKWEAPTGGEPGGGYRVYRGTSPTAITSLVGEVLAGTHTITDPGAILTPDSYYYVAKSFTGPTESGPSNMAYMLKKPLTYNVALGNKRIISLPYWTTYQTLADVLEDMNGIADITTGAGLVTPPTNVGYLARFNPATQAYETVSWDSGLGQWISSTDNLGTPNLETPTLVTGEALEIEATHAFNLQITGAYDPNFSFHLNYNVGMGNKNYISIPYQNTYLSLADIVEDVNGIADITTGAGLTTAPTKVGYLARLNPDTQAYETVSWDSGLGQWISSTDNLGTPNLETAPVVIGEGYEAEIIIISNLDWKPTINGGVQ
jgi:hypothetical protein